MSTSAETVSVTALLVDGISVGVAQPGADGVVVTQAGRRISRSRAP